MAFFQHTAKSKIVEMRSTPGTPSPKYSPFQEFVQNTSLLGVQHFLRNKSFVWLLAYLICVAMSIVQSWSVTVTFFEQKTYHTITIASKSQMAFPSVTICTNTVLQEGFNFSVIPGFNVSAYDRLLNECSNMSVMHELKYAMELNKMAVKKYLRTLSEDERLHLGLNLTTVVNRCEFGSFPCNLSDPNEFHIHNLPIYGNCFTYNPAFDDALAKYAQPDQRLELLLRFPSQGYWITSRSRAKLAVQVHPPGTAPLIESVEVEDVFENEKVSLVLSLESEMISIKKDSATIPSCVDDDDETYRKRSIHYSKKSPYKYSLQACLKSCKEEAFRECGYLYHQIPVQSKEYEKGKVLANDLGSECELKPLNMEACNCPIPCRKVKYGVLRDDNDFYHIPCEEKPHHKIQFVTKKRQSNEYDNECRIIIYFRSSVYTSFEEQLSYGLSEYLGILGGNMSLWIGLCIISLLEVVELCIKSIAAALTPSRKPTQTLPSHFIMRQTR